MTAIWKRTREDPVADGSCWVKCPALRKQIARGSFFQRCITRRRPTTDIRFHRLRRAAASTARRCIWWLRRAAAKSPIDTSSKSGPFGVNAATISR